MGRQTVRTMAGMVAVTVLAVACSTGVEEHRKDALPSELDVVEVPGWAAVFDHYGVRGTFALHEVGTGEVRVHGATRARQPLLPASTFKILNSLIALETETVADVDEVVPWDGTRRPVPEWNTDHSLRTGIEVSAVWAYQHLAREVGAQRMAELVAAADYGNADIGGPIDEFWLRGDLRISAVGQLDVLARLLADDLPFESGDQKAVREILVRERGDSWQWAHKTGTALATQPVLGWLVGFTEFGGSKWVFAMNVDLGSNVDLEDEIAPNLRQAISRSILEAEGALPPQ
ncbi:MAG: penicillin-binding transpeptidase domain-containing protein [Acidimicrobiales bacterium]